MIEKDANVTSPKTKCDTCSRPAIVVAGVSALCGRCRQEMHKQAQEKAVDVYHIPTESN